MNYASVFHLISDLVKKKGISCVVIGGFAVNYYKVHRNTADVDFLITKADFDKIGESLKQVGYKEFSLQENFAQLESSQIALWDIDFIFVDREVLETIIREGQTTKIVGQEFIVPSLNHLIALKLHAIKWNLEIRLAKDLLDIINLIRINKVDIKAASFKELCLKFGTEEIYQKLLEAGGWKD